MRDGVQEDLIAFARGCCNVESILVCVYARCNNNLTPGWRYILSKLVKVFELTRTGVDCGVSKDGYVDDSSKLLNYLGFAGWHEVERTTDPGTHLNEPCVVQFAHGGNVHFVVGVFTQNGFALLHDGYNGNSVCLREGDIKSIRFYDQ